MSKLGPHVLQPTDAAMAWARRAPLVKAVDDTRALREARPDAIKIFRKYFPVQNINVNGALVVDYTLAALGDAPATHIELFNEVGVGIGHGLERYVAMTQEAVDYLTLIRPDLTVIGYSFSTGTPEPIDWDYLRAHNFGGVSVVGIHEYWGNLGFSQWHALRHRWLWKPGDPKIAITECGRDAVETGKGGWMKDGQAAETYAVELLAYDRELAKDAYIIGATPFTSGPTPDWAAFSMDTVSHLIPSSTPPVLPPAGGPPVTVTPIYSSPNHGGNRLTTTGIVIHATLGNSPTPLTEFNATVNWFDNPASQVSAHAIVGPGGKVAYPVDPSNIAWHAENPANLTHLGIEMCKARVSDPILPDILDAAAKIVAQWCHIYKIPIVWSTTHGIEEHRNTPPNTDGHQDVGGQFDRTDFLARVKKYAGSDDMTAEQRKAVLDDLDFLWSYSKATETAKNPAQSEKIIHERIVALKVTLGLQ